jgi:hypothetical protein
LDCGGCWGTWALARRGKEQSGVLGLAVFDKLGLSLEEEKSGLLGLAVVDKLGLSLEEEKSGGRRLDSNWWAGQVAAWTGAPWQTRDGLGLLLEEEKRGRLWWATFVVKQTCKKNKWINVV